jgi:hypothetical protein
MYAMTMIFLPPIAQDVTNLVSILHNFGDVTRLVTNAANSSIAAIQCDDIDLGAILADFPAELVQFPIKYLGLHLALGRLCHADLQPYIDKMARRLIPWKGKLIRSFFVHSTSSREAC